MTVNVQEKTEQVAETPKVTDKELNFRKQEELFKKQLEQERQARLMAEQKAAKLEQERSKKVDDDDIESDDPYVDQKALQRKLSKFEKHMEEKIDQRAEQKARFLLEEQNKNSYFRENNDFDQIMSSENIQKFADKHPRLAENILRMPEGFERQKLVYENIKALGVHKPEPKPESAQEKIDRNRQSPYYKPSGVGASPYQSQGDFSPSGQKNAYDKMQALKKALRI